MNNTYVTDRRQTDKTLQHATVSTIG